MNDETAKDMARLGAGALAGGTGENRMLNALLDSVPLAEDEMYEKIAEKFLSATNVFQLNMAFDAEGLEDYLGAVITITRVRRAESDFQDGSQFYLILDIIDEDRQVETTITTGAIKVLMQVCAAYRMGALPFTVVPKKGAKKTKNGYDTYELEVYKDQIQKAKEVVVPFERPDEEDLPF